MRWDRLFSELEAQVADVEREERDALVVELRDETWAQTSWRELLGGTVAVDVRGVGRLEGRAVLVNEHLVHLGGDRVDHLVATSAVMAVLAAERRADEPGRVAASLGWGHALRALRDAEEPVVVRLLDGTSREGVIDVVGRDFVRLASVAGRTQDVVWAAIAVVSGRT